MSRDLDGTNDYLEADTAAHVSSGALVIWIYITALPASQQQIFSFKNSGDGQPYATHDKNLLLNTDGTVTARIFSNDEHTVTSTETVPLNAWTPVGWSIGPTTTRGLRAWVMGEYAAFTGTGSDSSFTGYSTPALGVGQTAGSYSRFEGKVGEIAIYSDALSDGDWAGLCAGVRPTRIRPGSLLDYWSMRNAGLANHMGGDALTNTGGTADVEHPPVRRSAQILQFDRPSSGTTYEVSVSESATLAESIAADLAIAADITESVTLSEGVSVLIDMQQTVTEAVTLAETVAGEMVMESTIAESVTLTDTIAGGLLLESEVTDSVTLSEVATGGLAFDVDITESVTLTESTAGALTLEPGITDNVTISESIDTDMAMAAGITESVTITESLLANMIAAVEVVESVTLTDQPIGGLLYDVEITEVVNISEVLTTNFAGVATRTLAATMTVTPDELAITAAIADDLALTASVADDIAMSMTINE